MQNGQHLPDGRATESGAAQSPDPVSNAAQSVRHRSRSVANRVKVSGDFAGALARQNAADACLKTEHERLQPDTR